MSDRCQTRRKMQKFRNSAFLLLCFVVTWTPSVVEGTCLTTACLEVPQCPQRQDFLCALEEVKVTGTLRLVEFIRNRKLRDLFTAVATQVEANNNDLQSGVLSDPSSILRRVQDMFSNVKSTITSTCVIDIDSALSDILDATEINWLEYYLRLKVRNRGQIESCPNRIQLLASLKTGVDVYSLIDNINYSKFFGTLSASHAEFKTRVDSGHVASIAEIATHVYEQRGGFFEGITTSCSIVLLSNTTAMLYGGFDQAVEVLVGDWLVAGGILPESCTDRLQVVQLIDTAYAAGSFDLSSITSLTALYDVVSELLKMRRSLWATPPRITEASQVLAILQSQKSSFNRILGPEVCAISVPSGFSDLVDEAFSEYERISMNILNRKRRNTGIVDCDSRLAIQGQLVDAVANGNILELIQRGAFADEFSEALTAHHTLVKEIEGGGVSGRAHMREFIENIRSSFLRAITDTCAIYLSPQIEAQIDGYFSGLDEYYCTLITAPAVI